MTPQEFWWWLETKMGVKMYGNLSEDKAEMLYQEIKAGEFQHGDYDR